MFTENSSDALPNAIFSGPSGFFTGGVSEFFYQLGMEPPSAEDSFCVLYKCDILTLKIERTKKGSTESVRFIRNGSRFDDLVVFDPKRMVRKERDLMIRKLYGAKMSQKQIAEIMDVTQQTVSNVCNDARCSVSHIRKEQSVGLDDVADS